MTYELPVAYEPDPMAFPHPIEAARFRMSTIVTTHQLTRARHLAGISQRHLAELLGTTETTVSRLERGTTPIDTRWSSHLTLLFAHIIPLARQMEEDR